MSESTHSKLVLEAFPLKALASFLTELVVARSSAHTFLPYKAFFSYGALEFASLSKSMSKGIRGICESVFLGTIVETAK